MPQRYPHFLMSFMKWGCLFSNFIFFSFAAIAAPKSPSLYQRPVHVSTTATSLKVAKKQALEQALLKAWQNLLSNMCTADDVASLEPLTSEQLQSFILGFSLDQEKMTKTHYSATIRYQFNPKAVLQFLRDKKIPCTDHLPEKVFVIPMHKNNGKLHFWEGNAWLPLWKSSGLDTLAITPIFPFGDLEDKALLPDMDAGDFSEETFKAFTERYGHELPILFVLTDKNYTKTEDAPYAFSLLYIHGDTQITLRTTTTNNPRTSIPFILLSQLQSRLKQDTLSTTSERNIIQLTFPAKNLKELKRIETSISALTFVTELKLINFSTQYASFMIYYYGTKKDLMAALSKIKMPLPQTIY